MFKLMIVAHAPLASALLSVGRHAFPECALSVRAFDVQAEQTPEQVAQVLKSALAEQPGQPVLILTDVAGATPHNGAMQVVCPNVALVSGVNVPMLWRALCYRSDSLEDLLVRAREGAVQHVQTVAPCAPDATPQDSTGRSA